MKYIKLYTTINLLKWNVVIHQQTKDYLSSICNWGDGDYFKPVYFFSRKDFKCKKKHQTQNKLLYLLRSLCTQKIVAFVVFCSLVFVLLVGFLFASVFMRAESFRKK